MLDYLSDVIGIDCKDMCLRDFIEYLASDANMLDVEIQSHILEIVREEQANTGSSPYSRYWYLHQ